MIWRNGELKNPLTGKLLERDSAHSLSNGGAVRFPIVDEIPFLRIGREKLSAEVLRALDLKDQRAALVLLLQDQDDWARTPAPTAEDLEPLFAKEHLTLREAMQCLKYGAVADYFAYRWSDPTFLSGLGLLEWHLPAGTQNVFELCCGIGHYLREILLRGIGATGADVVFSKLWLARKFVAPMAKLVCMDANFALPFADKSFDAAFCHDAFYFLPKKQSVVAELKRVRNETILIGHAHNAEADNFSSGAAISVKAYEQLFDDPILYDDAELTRSVIEDQRPQPQERENLRSRQAVAIVEELRRLKNNELHRNFSLPIPGQRLGLNPLLIGEEKQILTVPHFPSERYEKEYAALSDYLILKNDAITFADKAKALNGEWHLDHRLINFARRRIFLDLPEKW